MRKVLLSFSAPALFVLMAGCSTDTTRTAANRTADTADRAANTADRVANRNQVDIDDYVAKMNAKIDDLRARVDQRVKDSGDSEAHWDRMKSRLDDLRKDVNDLRTEDATNWWDHAKDRIDRAWNNVDKDFEAWMKDAGRRANANR